ncbi:hypothetical protein CRM22_000740, partial [Opisthorchis felineus]
VNHNRRKTRTQPTRETWAKASLLRINPLIREWVKRLMNGKIVRLRMDQAKSHPFAVYQQNTSLQTTRVIRLHRFWRGGITLLARFLIKFACLSQVWLTT